MAELRWTPQAADDLESIVNFIAIDSVQYASMVALRIVNETEKLIQFPTLGRIVPELNNSTIRELIIGNYRAIYRTTGESVEVLTIWHGARTVDTNRLR